MNLALLLPAALAALAALLLPLLIHLARRSEQRPTDFAALRWLRHKPKPRHRIRFDEWPLLLLRLLLLALLALWLARPVLHGIADDRPWTLVLPSVDADALRAEVAGHDTRAELRWLAPGFPRVDTPPPGGVQPVASLLRELDRDLPSAAKLSVLVPAQFDGADAQRPRLSRTVQWRVLAGDATPAAKPAPTAIPALDVRYAPGQEDRLRYLRAAAASWQVQSAQTPGAATQNGQTAGPVAALFSAAPVEQPLPAEARALVWLAPGPLPEAIRQWIAAGGTALLDSGVEFERPAQTGPYWADATGATLVEGGALGQGRVLRFTRPLQPASMPQLLEAEFPRQLRRLFSTPPAPPARVAAVDYAPMTGATAYPQAPRDLQPWLALLIALLLLIERWLATSPRRSAAP